MISFEDIPHMNISSRVLNQFLDLNGIDETIQMEMLDRKWRGCEICFQKFTWWIVAAEKKIEKVKLWFIPFSLSYLVEKGFNVVISLMRLWIIANLDHSRFITRYSEQTSPRVSFNKSYGNLYTYIFFNFSVMIIFNWIHKTHFKMLAIN